MSDIGAVADIGFGIYDRITGQGSDTARSDQRWMNDFSWKQSLRNEELQNKLATQGIRMKVADAEAAGLHPLAALGATGAQASPSVAVFGGSMDRERPRWEGLGQNISRAVMSGATQEEKAFKQLQLDKLKTENEILNVELISRKKALMAPGTGPGISQDPYLRGQGNSPVTAEVVNVPYRRTMTAKDQPLRQAAAVADLSFSRTPYGYAPIPSKDVKEQIEDQFAPELAWALRNYVLPNLGLRDTAPGRDHLPKGYDYFGWSTSLQQWVPRKKWFSIPYGKGRKIDVGP